MERTGMKFTKITLNDITKQFDKTLQQLEKLIEDKQTENGILAVAVRDIETQVQANQEDIARAQRIQVKINEIVK